ncbi:MAG TPA: endonuclease domain-containing protein [Chitinophagaceae bacterium]
MLLDQDYACLICDIVFDSGGHATKCCVDHDHTTGKVRGLICHDCNVGLSRFKDDPEILRNAIKYLKKWGSK